MALSNGIIFAWIFNACKPFTQLLYLLWSARHSSAFLQTSVKHRESNALPYVGACSLAARLKLLSPLSSFFQVYSIFTETFPPKAPLPTHKKWPPIVNIFFPVSASFHIVTVAVFPWLTGQFWINAWHAALTEGNKKTDDTHFQSLKPQNLEFRRRICCLQRHSTPQTRDINPLWCGALGDGVSVPSAASNGLAWDWREKRKSLPQRGQKLAGRWRVLRWNKK